MDKPISVGDLVVVVRKSECPRCDSSQYLGLHFRVVGLRDTASALCGVCDFKYWHGGTLADSGSLKFLTNRLKRIPPLEDLEGEKRDEKLTEPA